MTQFPQSPTDFPQPTSCNLLQPPFPSGACGLEAAKTKRKRKHTRRGIVAAQSIREGHSVLIKTRNHARTTIPIDHGAIYILQTNKGVAAIIRRGFGKVGHQVDHIYTTFKAACRPKARWPPKLAETTRATLWVLPYDFPRPLFSTYTQANNCSRFANYTRCWRTLHIHP